METNAEVIIDKLKNKRKASIDDILSAVISNIVSPVKKIYFVAEHRDYPTTAWEDSYIAEIENGLYVVVWYGECGAWFNVFKNRKCAEIHAKEGFDNIDVLGFTITAIIDCIKYDCKYCNEAKEQIERILKSDLEPQDDKYLDKI